MDGIIERDLPKQEMHIETTLAPTAPAQMSDAEFAGIYELHYRDVYRYVLALTRSRDEAEDVSAEAFERAYLTWTSEHIDGGRALPWLLLTARRIATDRWRRVRRLRHLLPRVRRASEDPAEHSRTEFWLWFDALCEALPERQREVLVLRYQRDLSDTDIGSIMELTESGVRSLSARALTSLRGHPELLS